MVFILKRTQIQNSNQLGPFYKHTYVLMINHIHCLLFGVVTHPCANFNGGSTAIQVKSSMHNLIGMQLLVRILNSSVNL